MRLELHFPGLLNTTILLIEIEQENIKVQHANILKLDVGIAN
jgi:hypothetical protein